MLDVHSQLFRWGITSWQQDIITAFPTSTANSFQIGKNLPTDVGFIYGLSIYADTVDANANTLITTTQATNCYLTLQNGASQFFDQIRLDDMLRVYAGSPIVEALPYMPVNLPVFDLSKSLYYNPTLIVSPINAAPIVIHLKLWYIQKDQYKQLLEAGLFGIPRPHGHPHHTPHR